MSNLLSKACENCRVRKIRCNRAFPCSNCETAGINCSRATNRATEQRSRVLLSANYERQIEQINDRLKHIEDGLKVLHVSKPSSTLDSISGAAKTPNSTSEAGLVSDATPTAFEGASSLTSQAVRAGQAAETSLNILQGSSEVNDALNTLQSLVRAPISAGIKQELRLGNDVAASKQSAEMKLLPAEFVLNLLRKFKSKPCALFLAYSFRHYKEIERICQQAYFPTEQVSLPTLTLMNGMLFYMIKEMIWVKDYGPFADYDIEGYYRQAERNFHLGVESYEIFVYPSIETIKVLMLAMLKSQEEGKPLLSWSFVSTGARHILCMGYHRKDSMKHDPPELAEDKKLIFWTFYTIDKNLAFTMGYNSNFPDNEIDIGYPQCSSDPGVRPWDKAANAMIEMSRLQGLIYDRLYSLQAQGASAEYRSRVATDLAFRMEQWYQDWSRLDSHSAHLSALFFFVYGAMDVVYFSMLTSIHRAAILSQTSVEISSSCYEAAKKSLQSHLKFFPAFTSYDNPELIGSYVSWILLYGSWTPLIAVFLHAIASSSMEDVNLLDETERSLRPLKGLNRPSDQVYGLCKMFSRLARAFVEQNSSFFGTYNEREDVIVMPQSDIDLNPRASTTTGPLFNTQYRSNLGEGDITTRLDHPEVEDISMFLGNWFGGQQPTADLWDVDFGET